MHPALTLVDEFLPHETALRIREGALAAGFKDLHFMGGTYQGTGVEFKPPEPKKALEAFFGSPVHIHISAFRSGHEDTKLHVNIHADNPVGRWAGVYYLNLPEDCKGGTAFWRMKETGWDEMPTQEVLDASPLNLEQVKEKWERPEDWDMVSLAGMKFNRFIFYPTPYFHSRFPLEGWGKQSDPAHARLVWVVFFDVLA